VTVAELIAELVSLPSHAEIFSRDNGDGTNEIVVVERVPSVSGGKWHDSGQYKIGRGSFPSTCIRPIAKLRGI
jgi:hypothetical protein